MWASHRVWASRRFLSYARHSPKHSPKRARPPPPSRTPPPSSPPSSAFPGETLASFSSLLRFGASAYVIQVYVANSTLCEGPSMLPTLNVRGDVLFTEYLSPRLGLLRAGDVVVAIKPNDSSTTVVKRIRGMPGDRIAVRARGRHGLTEIEVPPGHVWLEGDNPQASTDSREYGPVALGLVRGRVVCRFFPFNQICRFRTRVIDHGKGG